MTSRIVDRLRSFDNTSTVHLLPGAYTDRQVDHLTDILEGALSKFNEEESPTLITHSFGHDRFTIPHVIRDQEDLDYITEKLREFVNRDVDNEGNPVWQVTPFKHDSGRIVVRVHPVGTRWTAEPGLDLHHGKFASINVETGKLFVLSPRH